MKRTVKPLPKANQSRKQKQNTNRPRPNKAQISKPLGGISMRSADLALEIKYDSRGVPLPMARQNMAQLARILGFDCEILDIKPLTSLPFFVDKNS